MRLFCWHKWKLIGMQNILRNVDRVQIGNRFTLQCEKCGNLKIKNIK